jgi:hypothetical protein
MNRKQFYSHETTDRELQYSQDLQDMLNLGVQATLTAMIEAGEEVLADRKVKVFEG